MSDGKSDHAGLLRTGMKAMIETLRSDSFIIENDVDIAYKLDHPSKQIEGDIHRFHMRVEPAGFSQTSGAGTLDVQYHTWIVLKCRPNSLGHDDDDALTYICEHLMDALHRVSIGGLSTYVSRVLLVYKDCDVTSNHRTVRVNLGKDEIGAVIWLWQTPKSIAQVDEESDGEFESATTVKVES